MIEVIILYQAHASTALKTILNTALNEQDIPSQLRKMFNIVANSQFLIASYLDKNKDIPFISENRPDTPRSDEEKWYVNRIFPNAMPKLFSQLSFEQKWFLASQGANAYAMCRGQNSFSDGAAAIQSSKLRLRKKFNFSSLVIENQFREFATLSQAMTMANKNQNKKIVIIYGYNHKFLDVANICFPNEIKLNIEKSCDAFLQKTIETLPEYAIERKQIHSLLPAVNCTYYIERATQLGQPSSQHQILATTSQASYGATTIASVFATLGMITYGLSTLGLFRCCRRKRHYTKKQTEENTFCVTHN
jgi:hypothetical protein